jgi:hypothetical protein
MTNIPLVLGPLDEPQYIADITEDFREEKNREPSGAAELLHWHRRRINKNLRGLGVEVTADLQITKVATDPAARNPSLRQLIGSRGCH